MDISGHINGSYVHINGGIIYGFYAVYFPINLYIFLYISYKFVYIFHINYYKIIFEKVHRVMYALRKRTRSKKLVLGDLKLDLNFLI